MGKESLNLWEKESHEKLINDTQKLRRFNEEIKVTEHKRLDELHLGFYQQHPEINDIHDIELVRKVFTYLKSK
ncbi:hypothetical protein [Clostridium paraputrificum]|uniref:hypothetical protein n=1 Tax=Clostridium paraputrificum TaxID=29363 RepID=UPI00189DA6F4|nr:hypothetical protein [Clostridium paraputrificum]